MHECLSSLGDLRVGYQVRGSVRNEADGDVAVIQLGNVQEEGMDMTRLVRMNLERAGENDFLAPGDLLLRSRGASYRAAVIPGHFTERIAAAPIFTLQPDPPYVVCTEGLPLRGVVAAVPLYIFRSDRTRVIPEYLVWYINRNESQAALTAHAHGTHIPTVGLQAFAEMEVLLPPLSEQRKIAEISALQRQESEMTLQLLGKREQFTQASLERFIQRKGRKSR